MRFWRTAMVGGFVSLGLCGCEDQVDIVPVSPPGAIIPRVSPDADPAQALGETAPSTNAASTPATAAKPSTPAPAEAIVSDIKPAPPTAKGETKTTARGVKYETLKEGTGAELKPGQRALMHYVGKLEDGSIFDSNRPGSTPFVVAIGTGRVIKGWDEGIPGMKVGETRKLTIPSAMGYGKRGSPPKIPPDTVLIFEVELVEIQ
jgi:FKBP-type peptidyl-prolyl cis-trans isomerase